MNRLQHLVFRVRAALLRREIEALQRRLGKANRTLLNRPHVPSAYLVPGYGVGAEPLEAIGQIASTVLWCRAAALAVTFGAGLLVAGIGQHAPAPADLACTSQYQPLDQ